jgi:hypothetical protein
MNRNRQYALENWQASGTRELVNNLYPNYDPRHNTGMTVEAFGGWRWTTADGREYRTDSEGYGLWFRTANGDWQQERGTCQFSLSADRQKALRQLKAAKFALAQS